ncbi:MAG: hypothetical protein QOG67_2266 [Verrucomicrobiota bacterium]|jgi:hypothetical protein
MSPDREAAPTALWRRFLSAAAIITFVILFLFIHPLCNCPSYDLELATLGIVPLLCGPRVYRWLGAVLIVFALLVEQQAKAKEHLEIQRIRAKAETQPHHTP